MPKTVVTSFHTESKCCGAFPAKVGLYVIIVTLLVATMGFYLSGRYIEWSLSWTTLFLALYALHGNRKILLLIYLIVQVVFFLLFTALLLIHTVQFISGKYDGDTDIDYNPNHHRQTIYGLIFLFVCIVLPLFISSMLTYKVYQHAREKEARQKAYGAVSRNPTTSV
ncbi:unnamed protein product [Caenorhabditis auriculariae]|uniref:Uncharacterized protein n=1 Tax=Caenorhabditis auriculariae TaxID=2777116 RepID=A0A8S1HI79_9PELO|nr:unnamed protein product [Caenorhabditis auriculariae]